MNLTFAAGVFARRTQNTIIVLDARANRVFALPPRAVAALQRRADREFVNADTAIFAQLSREHLLSGDPEARVFTFPGTPAPPHAELTGGEHASARDLIAVAIEQVRADRLCRAGYLAQAIARSAEHRERASRSTGDRLSKLSIIKAAFERLNLFFPVHDRCLPRSLAFAWVALRRGLSVEVIVGVTATPFSAHSWVQADGQVVNDRLERVTGYAPLAAL